MTVIRHNSISGIVSITAAAGSNLSFYDSTGATLSLDTGDINAGVITATTANFTNATVTGDLTVQGTTTTLDTTVTEVDRLEVGSNNTTVGVAITQSGTGDILRLYDSSTQVVTVKDGGSVGIGTDNPIMRLHVHGAANSADSRIRLSSIEGSGLTIRAQSATENNINADSGEDITFSRGNVESLRINSNGNVGINTTADIRQLEIYNSSHATAALKSNTQSSLFFSDDDTNIGQISYMHSSNYMYFRVNDAERLRITSSGRVGIGTDNPDALLHTYHPTTNTTAFFESGDANCSVHLADSSGSVTFNTRDNGILRILTGGDSSSPGTNATERLRITSSGNVGIGTDNPQTALVVDRDWVNNYGSINIKSSSDVLSGVGFRTDGGYAGGFIYRDGTTGNFFELNAQGSREIRALLNGSERLRINAKAELIQTSATNSTNSWYSLNSNNIVKVTNGDNDIYIERVGGPNDYDQLVYKKTPMTDNCDISFRLVGNSPNTTHRHVGFTICGDGGSSWTDMDRIVFRYRPSNTSSNLIRIDKAGGGSTGNITSASIPNFFDSTERNILIQVRGRNIHVLSDNVLVYSEEMDAALHSVTGYFGVCIYEAPYNGVNPYIFLKNFQLTNYGALGVPQKRPCLQTNMSSTYGSSGSLTTTVANSAILQASAYIDLCGNYTTSGTNAYTFECPVDGIYAVNAHISMGSGSYSRTIWVMSYTMSGGNLPLGTYTEVIDIVPDTYSNHSYYNLWKFTKGTRVGMGINGSSGSLSGRNFQWGIMLVS